MARSAVPIVLPGLASAQPSFPVALKGLAALSTLSGLLGPFSTISGQEDGATSAARDPMAYWSKPHLDAALFLAPGREHVVVLEKAEHRQNAALRKLCAKWGLKISNMGD